MNFRFALWIVVWMVVSTLVFNTTMSSYDHNEQMYVTAGVLVSQGQQLYADFAYLQTPALPLLYGLIFRLVDASAYLFVAKVATFLFYLGAAFTLYNITRHLTRDQFLPAALTTLFMLNSSMMTAVRESSNYMLPILLIFAAFYLYLRAQEPTRWSYVNLVLCGACLAFAVATKLYYALLIPPFLLILAYTPRATSFQQRLYRQLAPLSIGLLIGSIPILWYLWKDFQDFWFYNVGYHVLNTEWRKQMGYERAMTLPTKLAYAAELFEETTSSLLVALSALALLACRYIPSPANHRHMAPALLSIALVIASIPAVMIPTPIFEQYYSMPFSLLFLLLAVLYPTTYQLGPGHTLFNQFLLVILVLSAVITVPGFQEDLENPWVTDELSTQSREIAELIDSYTDRPGKMATFAPLFALEGGETIYPELATGPFLYRVGNLLTPTDRSDYNATSSDAITSLLTQNPPVAIFLVSGEDSTYADSSYAVLEEPLRRFAQEHGYRKVERDFYDSELYVLEE